MTALVTGAGGDIGRAMVRALLARSVFVMAVDHQRHALDNLANEFPDNALVTLQGDVTDEASVSDFVSRAQSERGRIDLLYNNAGIEGPVCAIPDYPLVEFNRVLGVNVVGMFLVMKHVIPFMAVQSSGRIINIASVAGLGGGPNLSAYIASKHAVVGLTRAAAAEWDGHGIQVICIAPGAVRGRMMAAILDGQPPQVRAARSETVGGPRFNDPAEVAQLAAALGLGETRSENGAVYRIEGGVICLESGHQRPLIRP